MTLGHEFCGRIKIAPAGSKFKVGQPVMVDPHIACKSADCFACSAGQDHLCDRLAFLGASGAPGGGGLSEYAAVDDEMLHVLPENVDLDSAAVIEPLVVANHVIKVTKQRLKGQTTLIVGGGPIGIALAILLEAQNVKTLILSEPTRKRREQARTLELIHKIIDPKAENLGDICRELTAGKGVDVVFDCAGVAPALESALDGIAYGGTYVNVAMWEKPVMTVKIPSPGHDADMADPNTVLSVLQEGDQIP